MADQNYYIGEAAGKIFKTLENGAAKPATQVQKESGLANAALFNQAVGWLARESKIKLNQAGKTVKISLN